MPRNRLLTLGNPISFRLQSAQSYRLRKHEMRVGESANSILNRQLRRLRQAILEGAAPPEPTPAPGAKPDYYSLKPELEVVKPFIDQMRDERGWKNDRVAVEFLVVWSCELPIVVPLLSAAEMMQSLVRHFGQGAQSVPIRTALLAVSDRVSPEQAKIWLWELRESGRVKLRIPHEEQVAGLVVRLPDGRGKLYFYVDL